MERKAAGFSKREDALARKEEAGAAREKGLAEREKALAERERGVAAALKQATAVDRRELEVGRIVRGWVLHASLSLSMS